MSFADSFSIVAMAAAVSLASFARADVADRLPNAIFTWMDEKDKTGIRGDRLPFWPGYYDDARYHPELGCNIKFQGVCEEGGGNL